MNFFLLVCPCSPFELPRYLKPKVVDCGFSGGNTCTLLSAILVFPQYYVAIWCLTSLIDVFAPQLCPIGWKGSSVPFSLSPHDAFSVSISAQYSSSVQFSSPGGAECKHFRTTTQQLMLLTQLSPEQKSNSTFDPPSPQFVLVISHC